MKKFVIALGCVLFTSSMAFSHSGGIAKDGCHNKNEVVNGVKTSVERHWHIPDSVVRGGECVTDDKGITVKTASDAKKLLELKDQLDKVNADLADTRKRLSDAQTKIMITGQAVNQANYKAKAAEEKAKREIENYKQLTLRAQEDADEARLRAAGFAPRVDKRCTDTLTNKIMNAETDWYWIFSDSIVVTQDDIGVIITDCINE